MAEILIVLGSLTFAVVLAGFAVMGSHRADQKKKRLAAEAEARAREDDGA